MPYEVVLMKPSRDAFYAAINLFVAATGLYFPLNHMYKFMSVTRYYPLADQWGVGKGLYPGPSMGLYGGTFNAIIFGLVVFLITFAVAYLIFAKTSVRLSTKAELSLALIAIIGIVIGVAYRGNVEYLHWVLGE